MYLKFMKNIIKH